MAIRGRTLTAVQDDLQNVGTSEATFRSALTADVAYQVDSDQINLAASRSFTASGDLSGTSTTFQLNDAADYTTVDIPLTINNGAVDGAAIDTDTITSAHIVNGTIINEDIANNTISHTKIASTSKEFLQILDVDGTTVLFDGYVLTG